MPVLRWQMKKRRLELKVAVRMLKVSRGKQTNKSAGPCATWKELQVPVLFVDCSRKTHTHHRRDCSL